MAAIQGRLAELWLGAGSATSITKEACENVSGYIYHVTDPDKRYLDPETAILVYDNDVLQTSGYEIVGGCQIHFAAAPTAPVTVSGKYYTPAEVAYVQNWDLTLESEVFEVTSLGDTSKQFVGSGLLGWSGSFERLYEDNTWAAKAAANSTRLLLRLFEDQPSGYVWTGWVGLTSWGQQVPVAGLESESISFTGVGKPAYTTDET